MAEDTNSEVPSDRSTWTAGTLIVGFCAVIMIIAAAGFLYALWQRTSLIQIDAHDEAALYRNLAILFGVTFIAAGFAMIPASAHLQSSMAAATSAVLLIGPILLAAGAISYFPNVHSAGQKAHQQRDQEFNRQWNKVIGALRAHYRRTGQVATPNQLPDAPLLEQLRIITDADGCALVAAYPNGTRPEALRLRYAYRHETLCP